MVFSCSILQQEKGDALFWWFWICSSQSIQKNHKNELKIQQPEAKSSKKRLLAQCFVDSAMLPCGE